jgi:hypothetical protein
VQRHGDLEIQEDLPFQRREWLVERVAWGVMALLIVAALLGLFGTGPFSRATAGDETIPLSLEYDRYGRLLAPATLRVHIGRDIGDDGFVRVWFERRYMETVELQQVTPEPENAEAAGDRLIFAFRLTDPERPSAITFNIRPSRFGLLSGRVGLIDGPTLRFQQFVYP